MLSPTHFWTQDTDGGGQCFWCKLRLKRLDSCAALRAKLDMPCLCPGGRESLPVLISVGVHRSHSFQTRGQQLFCEQCHKQRPVHRLGVFSRCCPKEGRRRQPLVFIPQLSLEKKFRLDVVSELSLPNFLYCLGRILVALVDLGHETCSDPR